MAVVIELHLDVIVIVVAVDDVPDGQTVGHGGSVDVDGRLSGEHALGWGGGGFNWF